MRAQSIPDCLVRPTYRQRSPDVRGPSTTMTIRVARLVTRLVSQVRERRSSALTQPFAHEVHRLPVPLKSHRLRRQLLRPRFGSPHLASRQLGTHGIVEMVRLPHGARLSHPPGQRGILFGRGWGRIAGMRLGIAHHFGWAVAVTASADHKVVDRRRIELIEPGLPAAPIHHVGGPHPLHRSAGPLDDDALAVLVADVRTSVVRATSAALEELATASPEPIVSMSLRAWPVDFPKDVAVQRRVPYESRANSVMYCQVLAERAHERGWVVHCYNSKDVVDEAARILGERADEVLYCPRATLGPPWSKDHRMALAATIVVT